MGKLEFSDDFKRVLFIRLLTEIIQLRRFRNVWV